MTRDQSFTEAYKTWTGEKWEWKNAEGKPNHPLDSSDETIKAFYMGYSLCARESKQMTKEFDSITELKIKLERIEKDIKNFRKIK